MRGRNEELLLKIEVEHTLPVGFTRAISHLSNVLGARMSELTDAVAALDEALNNFINSEASEDAQAELDRATIASLNAQIADLEAGNAASVEELRKVRDALQAQADANNAEANPAPVDTTPAPPVDGGGDVPPADGGTGDVPVDDNSGVSGDGTDPNAVQPTDG